MNEFAQTLKEVLEGFCFGMSPIVLIIVFMYCFYKDI